MKTLIMNTIPHSGTHTMLYLFHKLGGIPMYWEHFTPGYRQLLDTGFLKIRNDRDSYVMLQTVRSGVSTHESWTRRDPKSFPQLKEDRRVRAELNALNYPCDFVFPIEASNEMRTELALEIFDACEVLVTDEAAQFMKTWRRLNRWKEENRGFKDNAEWTEFRSALTANRYAKWLQQ